MRCHNVAGIIIVMIIAVVSIITGNFSKKIYFRMLDILINSDFLVLQKSPIIYTLIVFLFF